MLASRNISHPVGVCESEIHQVDCADGRDQRKSVWDQQEHVVQLAGESLNSQKARALAEEQK